MIGIGVGLGTRQSPRKTGAGDTVYRAGGSSVAVSAAELQAIRTMTNGGNLSMVSAQLPLTATLVTTNSNASLSAAQLPATPAQIAAASVIDWWRADQGITESGGAISNWAGIVNGKAWTQSTAGRKPTIVTDGWSAGINAIDFDASVGGSEDVMINTTATSTAKHYSLGLVYDAHALTNNTYLLDANQVLIALHESPSASAALGFFDGAHGQFGASSSQTGKQALLFTFSDETVSTVSGRCRVYRANSLLGNLAYTCKDIASTLGLFGNKLQNGNWTDGRLVDLVMYSKVLTAGESQLYFDYTLARYGV